MLWKNKKYIILIVACILSVLALCVIIVNKNNINASIIRYYKDERFYPVSNNFSAGSYHMYNMDLKTAIDVIENSDRYMGYYIEIEIENQSDKKMYDIDAKLAKKHTDIWYNITGLTEWQLDLEPKTKYVESLYIIVKVYGLNEDEVDELIRSLEIDSRSHHYG